MEPASWRHRRGDDARLQRFKKFSSQNFGRKETQKAQEQMSAPVIFAPSDLLRRYRGEGGAAPWGERSGGVKKIDALFARSRLVR
jgi:hypothetical protein